MLRIENTNKWQEHEPNELLESKAKMLQNFYIQTDSVIEVKKEGLMLFVVDKEDGKCQIIDFTVRNDENN